MRRWCETFHAAKRATPYMVYNAYDHGFLFPVLPKILADHMGGPGNMFLAVSGLYQSVGLDNMVMACGNNMLPDSANWPTCGNVRVSSPPHVPTCALCRCHAKRSG